jgi:hypothetical protein
MDLGRFAAFLAAPSLLLAACGGTSPHRNPATAPPAEISGTVEMAGGPWPGHFPPDEADVLVTNGAGATVSRTPVQSGAFRFALTRGDYQVSARAGDVRCGPPRHVSVPPGATLTLAFSCSIK